MKNVFRKFTNIDSVLLFSVLILLWSCGGDSEEVITPSAPKSGEFLQDDTYRVYPDESDNFANAEFRLWTPESSKPLRAVVVLTHSYNSNALGYAYSDYWQAFAIKENVALVAVYFKNVENSSSSYTDASGGTGKALLMALEQLTTKIGKSYIKDLPFLMRGYSAGGIFSYSFSEFEPERLLAYANIRGGSMSINSDSNLRIPALMFLAVLDSEQTNNRIIQTIAVKRFLGANWTLLKELETDHFGALEKPEEMIQLFFSKILENRLDTSSGQLIDIREDQGWLGDNVRLEAYRFSDYPYDKTKASWLIDQEFSEKWIEFQEE